MKQRYERKNKQKLVFVSVIVRKIHNRSKRICQVIQNVFSNLRGGSQQ